ncbi:glycoside hydrolase family protein [Brevundimonas sp. AJA228-03]|uniref:lysozyme n=1 Tax=Brevundimonas sp. AJA228-03 TaxID=2752515 RepID=UPI001ADF08FC|nr:lysozyme [Brevundimonas sp. AJA228-03]QTN18404.1 glycoside hydrolase family protein [Brevundimonas sp. AJA228-03]
MKISREGIVLIKSFEGFRPRAIRREDGGWVIGYGHTLSAREGASVSEADAELLLRYDLLPVETSVNEAGSTILNQHQFDALVSFVHSVGVDRFQSSDVLAHLVEGDADRAADALMGWPEPARPQAPLRRRVAERALFWANPDTDVVLSDLLAATPDIVAPTASETNPETPTASPEIYPPATETPPAIQTDPDDAEPGTVAVSMWLGETDAAVLPGVSPPPPVSEVAAESDVGTNAFAVPANDVAADGPTAPAIPDPFTSTEITATQLPEPEPEPEAEPEPGPLPEVTDDAGPAAASMPEKATVPTDASMPSAALPAERIAVTLKRYSPYGAAMIGPLPFLQPMQDRVIEPEPGVTPAIDPQRPATPTEVPVVADSEPATETSPIQEAIEVEPLILSPDDDAPTPALSREPWTVEERVELSDPSEAGLFGEDLSLTQGGAPILRHGDLEIQAPASFDWSETGAFIIMGAVGLTAFGAAMAAFRLAAEPSGGNETAIIAWVLALIGAGCVGVSSFNLYRRWGLPGGDN